jgi:hypothetical protein
LEHCLALKGRRDEREAHAKNGGGFLGSKDQMTPQMQEFPVHDPARGKIGDCFRAALASLRDIPIAKVPHFARDHWPDELSALRAMNAFLASRGLALIHLPRIDFEVMHREGVGDIYHLILGIDPEGDGHACIGLNGRIVHDPHPLRRGMANDPGKWTIALLVRTGVEAGKPPMKAEIMAAERALRRSGTKKPLEMMR